MVDFKDIEIDDSIIEQKFWANVKKNGQGKCWIWLGGKSCGYGHISLGNKVILAHRFAYELLREPIPEGMFIDHLCRNPSCVNPDHLEVVTNKENILRGINVMATNSKVTHCPQGHPYDLFNTYYLCPSCQFEPYNFIRINLKIVPSACEP